MTSQFVITAYTLIKFGSQDITEKVMKNTNNFKPSFTKKTPVNIPTKFGFNWPSSFRKED